MIKWFCDVCKQEIFDSYRLVRLRVYQSSKERIEASVWSEENIIEDMLCHYTCADIMETEMKLALDKARRAVRACEEKA